MRVYHFLNEQYGLEAIREKHLKIGRINSLNDPFEHFHFDSDNYVVHKIINGRKNQANKNYGVICFSRNFSSPVQWAHYGDSHRGLCLGYEIPEENLIEVDYIDGRGTLEEFKEALNHKGLKFYKYMLSKKYKHWAYEEEFRLLLRIHDTAKEKLIFKKNSSNLELVEVILGCRSALSKKQIIEVLGPSKEVEVFSVFPAKSKYAMKRK